MGRILLWSLCGYVACVGDVSCHPLHDRWPSATAIYLLLLSLRSPDLSLWGAGVCGGLLDAAQGGLIGPRVVGGVLAVFIVSLASNGVATPSRLKRVCLSVTAVVIWLTGPVLLEAAIQGQFAISPESIHRLAFTAISTCLVLFAIQALWPALDHRE